MAQAAPRDSPSPCAARLGCTRVAACSGSWGGVRGWRVPLPLPLPETGTFFWRALFSSRLIRVSHPGPSPLAAEPYLPEALRFLSPWDITFSPTLVLGH